MSSNLRNRIIEYVINDYPNLLFFAELEETVKERVGEKKKKRYIT